MTMEIKGILKQIFAVQNGTSAKGNWQKQEILVEYGDTYPKTVQITCMGKVVDSIEQLTEGMQLTAHVNPESREYNGKYYTSINAWKLEFTGGKNVSYGPSKQALAEQDLLEGGDDLPF